MVNPLTADELYALEEEVAVRVKTTNPTTGAITYPLCNIVEVLDGEVIYNTWTGTGPFTAPDSDLYALSL